MTKLWPLKCILKGCNYLIIKKKKKSLSFFVVVVSFLFSFYFLPLGGCGNGGQWFRQETLLVQFSCSVISNSLQPHGMWYDRPPCPSSTPKACSYSCPSSCWCQPSHPLSCSSPPAFNLSQHQGFFKWVSSSHHVAKVLKFQLHYQSFQWIFRADFLQGGLVGSPCSPRDSQESLETPQVKSINSSALSFLYGPTFTSLHDY